MKKQQLIDLIYTLEEEAFDRVWLHRKNENHYQDPNIRPVIEEVLTKYNLKFGEQDEFDYNFWEGVLAATRLLTYNLGAKEFGYDQVGTEALQDYGCDYGFLDS